MNRHIALLLSGIVLVFTAAAHAGIKTRDIAYEQGGVKLTGYLAWDDAQSGKRPGVLVIHEWWGLNDYARRRARELAQLGYVAFAADMYGGVVARDADHARQLSGAVMGNDLLRPRAKAALDVLMRQPNVDTDRIAAIGYCFGGTTVLQMTYAGMPVRGVVSFHGGLMPPDAADEKNIKASILICHGADDPYIPAERITAVQESLRRAGADWQMIYFGGAQHSFTNPAADGSLNGALYNADADRRSWELMRDFFNEIFAPKLRAESCGSINNVHALGGIYLTGQPSPDDFALLKQRGVRAVINLRTDGEIRGFDERKTVEGLGMSYHHLPFRSPESLTDEVFDEARRLFRSTTADNAGVVMHCGSANRVGALWLVKRVLDDGLSFDEAFAEAKEVGLRMPDYERLAAEYIARKRE